MKTYSALVSWLVFTSALLAQTVPPALLVKSEGRSVPLGLARLHCEVRIFGSLAETATTMTFTNPTPRVMQGDLYFPLPEGATISGYALDIGGVMVDGVAVEKHEARRVFEQVVRQGIDPGLVQWTAGNNFQTRVFPIPANGSRMICVQYVTEAAGGQDQPAYHLPLRFKEKLREFSLRVEVVKPAAPPKVTQGAPPNFAFGRWRDSYVAETKLVDVALGEDVVVALPKAAQQPVLVEKAGDGQVFFAIQDFPAVPTRQGSSAAPRHVVVFWDASGSRGAADHKREIGVLRASLDRWLGGARGSRQALRVDLVLLRHAASKPQRADLTPAELPTWIAELEKVRYDGGTQLGGVGPLPGGPKPDFYLLFTDGISNFGREEPAPLDAPAYVFSADAGANHSWLHSLAIATGGQYFNLAQWKDADLAAVVGQPAWCFLSAAADVGQAEAMYPERPQPVAGRFLLAGKLAADTATVTIHYGVRGQTPQRRTFRVSRADAAEGSLLARLWAQKKLTGLMIHEKRNKQEITALGKQFGLVTPYTSLLVLDSLEQYVEHEIAPPKSLPALRDEYQRRIDTLEHQKRKQKSDKLAEVVRMWEQRVAWWNTEFKYPKDFKYPKESSKSDSFDPERVRSFLRLGPAVVPGMDFEGGAKAATAAKPEPKGPPPRSGEAKPSPLPATDSPRRVEFHRLSRQPEPARAASPAAKAPDPGFHAPGEAATVREVFKASRLPSEYSASAAAPRSERISSGPGETLSREPGVAIKPWGPDTPYLKELRAAKGKNPFPIYLANRAKYGTSPGFFLDCADFFREENNADLALQVLSNIAEMELEEAALLRVLAHRLVQIGQLDLAVQTFEKVLELRPEEPQSYRDLALTLAQRAEQAARDGGAAREANRRDYARAIDLLAHVVLTRWDGRFPEIEVIVLEEVNRIIPQAKAAGVSEIPLDPRLIRLLDFDVRIVMTWHADDTDIDLWVTEPSGERAFFRHNRTTIGGLVSSDFTGGYGPEEYLVRRAAHGTYKVEANYYGSRATRLLGPVTVQADVFTNYGRENELCKSLTFRLKEAQETVSIGSIAY